MMNGIKARSAPFRIDAAAALAFAVPQVPNATVLSVPAGLTYDLVLEHFIYSCPDRVPWTYDPTDLITFRTAEGNMEKLFNIERVVSAIPADIQTRYEIAEPIRDRIAGYSMRPVKQWLS